MFNATKLVFFFIDYNVIFFHSDIPREFLSWFFLTKLNRYWKNVLHADLLPVYYIAILKYLNKLANHSPELDWTSLDKFEQV